MPPDDLPPELPPSHIGTLNEAPLHAALKAWYAAPGAQFEVRVAGYVIDIVQDGLLVEIQTGSFGQVRRKITALTAAGYSVRLVHPIAARRWIVRLPQAAGQSPTRRRSPRQGTCLHLFAELVSMPRLILHPNLTLEVLLIEEEDVRRYDGKSWRRRGWRTEYRRLLAVTGRRVFATPTDLVALLPAALPDPFTSVDLREAAGITPRLAGQVCYCLREMEAIVPVGKRGNAYLYRRAISPDDTAPAS
ncbi:MAG: hypothetical protein Kow0077_12150 [Anaerolineae bacterium]